MNWTDRRRRFRAILKGDRCYHPASVFDPLSARIAQDLGFEVGMQRQVEGAVDAVGLPGEFAQRNAGRDNFRGWLPFAGLLVARKRSL
jgi:carboxyvinyl-carboxyphosphonate phosphorylmutase